MASESSMRARVVRALRPIGGQPVENSVWPGTPDVLWVGGLVELKSVAAWPVREATPLPMPHFTQTQRLWHVQWSDAGGASLVLVRVGSCWVAVDGVVAAANLGRSTRAELVGLSFEVWSETPKDEGLRRCVQDHLTWAKRRRRGPSTDVPAPSRDGRAAACGA